MRYLLFCLIILFSTTTTYGKSVVVSRVSASEIEAKAIMIFHLNLIAISNDKPAPKPDEPEDKVKVGDTCPICKGTGWNKADGNVKVECVQCEADGVVDKGDPILEEYEEFDPTGDVQKLSESNQTKVTYYIEFNGNVYDYDSNVGNFVCSKTNRQIVPRQDWKNYRYLNISTRSIGGTTGYQRVQIRAK